MAEPERADVARPRWRRAMVLGLCALVALWLVAVGALVGLGVSAASQGQQELESAADALQLHDVLDGQVAAFDAAAAEFDTADRMLSHPVVRSMHWVPVVGRQLRSAGQLASTTDELLETGTSSLAAIEAELDRDLDSAAGRLALLDTVEDQLVRLDTRLDRADLGPDRALVAPLHDARADADEQIGELRSDLADALVVLRAVDDVLRGPTSYLVLAASNAEMRVGSGMFLSVGRVDFDRGRMWAGEFHAADDIALPETAPVSEEMDRLWGWTHPGRDWRNLGFTPRFPVNAAIAADMWQRRGGEPVDGVLMLDVVGLQHLLAATGPIVVDGASISEENVAGLLLHEQYQGIDSAEANAARREQLSSVVGAVVERLGAGDVDPAELLQSLRNAQRGRHLLLWSPEPAQQSAWEISGLDGALDDRSVLLGLANVGGTKLDPFMDLDVDVVTQPDGDEVAFTIDVVVQNRTPDGQPSYVLGGDGSATYAGVVVAYVPRQATDVDVDGGNVVASGPDGHSDVVAVGVDVPAHDARSVQLRFRLPDDVARELELRASARVPPSDWKVGDREFTDRRRRAIPIGAG